MKKYILCMVGLFFIYGIAFAQGDTTARKIDSLYNEGNQAYKNQEYREAIDAYLQTASHPEAGEYKGSIYYNVSCCYSLLGEPRKAFEYLDSTIEAGYTDYQWMKEDSDFNFLKENYGKEFEKILRRAKSAKSEEILRKTPLAIIEYDNYDGPLVISDYGWEDINSPEMDTLRERYHLHDVVGSDGTEFEKMKKLLNWVATRWVHDGSKMAPERSALAILREVEKGKRFCCANYADVLIDCMRALGYPIRFVGLRTEDAAYNMGGGHGCVEVWSNQFQKWIFFDVQNNAWWEHDGMPLSAHECHRLFIDGREDELNFVGQHKQADYAQTKPVWSAYFYRVNNYWMGQNLFLISDTITPQLMYQGRIHNLTVTDQYDRAYPRLNRTKITLRNERPESLDTFTVILSHTMPYFDRFLVRIDEKEWEETSDTLQWVLKNGTNIIDARAVNSAGIAGKPSRISVRYNPGK